MTFKEMPYSRYDCEQLKKDLAELTESFAAAKSYEEAKALFLKSEEEANALMLQVHHSDKAVVGIYSYDIAVSKARKATNMAREQNFPLRITVEPENKK